MTSLDEPYVVSSYSVEGKAGGSWQVGVTALVEAGQDEKVSQTLKSKSSRKGSRSRRNIAVNTVQRSGVHLVDLLDQSPLSAFTVSPNVVFTAKAVSLSYPSSSNAASGEASTSTSTNSPRQRKTFAAVEQEGRHELWCWAESESRDGSSSGEASKQVLSLDSKAISLDVSSVKNNVLAICENGQVLVLNLDLQEVAKSTLSVSDVLRTTCSASVTSLNFLGSSPPATLLLPVLTFSSSSPSVPTPKTKKFKRKSIVSEDGNITATINYLAFDEERKQCSTVATCELPGDDIVDAVLLGSKGSVVVLHQSGQLITYQLASAPEGTHSAQQPVILECAVVKTLSLSTTHLASKQATLLALSASEASARSSSSSSFFLLAIPKASARDTVHLFLFDARYGLILAEQSLSIASGGAGEAAPLSLARLDGYNIGLAYTSSPGSSTDSGASATKRGVVQALPCSVPLQSSLADMIGKQALTQQYLAAGSVGQSLSTKFGVEDGGAAENKRTKLLEQLKTVLGQDRATDRDITKANEIFKAWYDTDGKNKSIRHPASFVTQLLKLLLIPGKPNLPVASGMITTLVSSSLATDSSYPAPGLVASLLPTNDWSTINSCLRILTDVPEASLVAALKHANTSKGTELHTVLRAVMKCPVTPAEFRKAIKSGLAVQDLEPILKVCEAWLDGDDEEKEKLRYGKTPGTAYVVPFLQAVLDAHLVTLLQTRSLHPLLCTLSELLNDQIMVSSSVLSLRGPLAEINKIHQSQLLQEKERKMRLKKIGSKNATAGKGKKLKDDPEERWRAKVRQQESTMMVGDYALEEFKL